MVGTLRFALPTLQIRWHRYDSNFGNDVLVACSDFFDVASLRGGEADFDQKVVPNSLLANEPSLSTQGTGGNCGS
jgi:hypothetical protein